MPTAAIIDAVRRASAVLPPVVLLSKAAYAPMLRNWASWFNRLGAGGVVVVGHDQEVVDLAEKLGYIACLDQPAPGSIRPSSAVRKSWQIWSRRDWISCRAISTWSGFRIRARLEADLANSPGTVWREVPPLRRAVKRMKMGAGEAFEFDIHDRPVLGQAGDLSIALLPETEYTRLDDAGPRPA